MLVAQLMAANEASLSDIEEGLDPTS
jgi:hypothetical protein